MNPLTLGLLVAAVVSAPAFAQNLIVNGSFESGAGGWTFTGGLTIVGLPDLPPAVGVDGVRVASLGGGDIPNSTLSQSFSVVPGSAYVLTLATAAFGDNFPGRFGSVRVDVIAPADSVLASQSFTDVSPGPSIGTNGFTRHTMQFTVPINTTSATLRITDTSPGGGVAVDTMIDDVRVFNQSLPSGGNLVVNGSFETPDIQIGYAHIPTSALAPWQTTDDSFELWMDGMQVDGSAPTYSFHGKQSLEVLSQAASGTVWQTVPTVPGEDYALSFYHTPRATIHSTLTVAINSEVVATLDEDGSTLSTFRWRRFRTNFTATASSTTISFSEVSQPGAGAHIDNVVLERLPVRATIRVTEVEVCWETVTNKAYQVQYRSELTTNAWSALGASRLGTGTSDCVRDNAPSGEPQRFYRIITVP
jgi:hypothetical protein